MKSYVDSYLEHYMICYDMTNLEADRENYKKMPFIYKEIEGMESCKKLVDEINYLEHNNDWNSFQECLKILNIDLSKDKVIEIAKTAIEVIDKF